MRRVRFRPQAIEDLKEIFDWIVGGADRSRNAEAFVGRIFERCESLAEFPMKGRARDDLQEGVRILPFERKAIIAYRVLPDAVEIISIVYKGRDYEAELIDDDQ